VKIPPNMMINLDTALNIRKIIVSLSSANHSTSI